MIWIVGSGTCRGNITENVKRIIKNAEIVFGSRRALEIANVTDKGKVITDFSREGIKSIIEENKDKEIVFVSTGDPMVSGLGKLISEISNGLGVEFRIEPGISSVQVALAKLSVDLTEVVVVDCHARFDKSMLDFSNRHLLILADRKFDLSSLGNREVVILENLCMNNERIQECKAKEGVISSDYAIVFVRR